MLGRIPHAPRPALFLLLGLAPAAVPAFAQPCAVGSPVAGADVGADATCSATEVVPGIARSAGASGAYFRTTLWAANPGSSDASFRLTFVPSPGTTDIPSTSPLDIVVPAQASRTFDDLLLDGFGLTGPASGSLLVEGCDGPRPDLSARTWNDAGDAGTFGQYIRGFAASEGGTGSLRIEGLGGGTLARTNVGVVNTGSTTLDATVTLFDETGTSRGAAIPVTVPPHASVQVNAVDVAAGVAGLGLYGARIEAPAGGLAAYASWIDNRTNDPIFVPGNLPERATQWIDGVASAPGSGTYFRTTLVLANRGKSAADVTIDFTLRGSTTPSATASVRVAPGETRRWNDVLSDLLGTVGAGSLTLRTSESTPVVAWARTWSDLGDAGSLGQFIPAFGAENLLPASGTLLAGLSDDGKFRANVGLANRGASDAVVTLAPLRGRDSARHRDPHRPGRRVALRSEGAPADRPGRGHRRHAPRHRRPGRNDLALGEPRRQPIDRPDLRAAGEVGRPNGNLARIVGGSPGRDAALRTRFAPARRALRRRLRQLRDRPGHRLRPRRRGGDGRRGELRRCRRLPRPLRSRRRRLLPLAGERRAADGPRRDSEGTRNGPRFEADETARDERPRGVGVGRDGGRQLRGPEPEGPLAPDPRSPEAGRGVENHPPPRIEPPARGIAPRRRSARMWWRSGSFSAVAWRQHHRPPLRRGSSPADEAEPTERGDPG